MPTNLLASSILCIITETKNMMYTHVILPLAGVIILLQAWQFVRGGVCQLSDFHYLHRAPKSLLVLLCHLSQYWVHMGVIWLRHIRFVFTWLRHRSSRVEAEVRSHLEEIDARRKEAELLEGRRKEFQN